MHIESRSAELTGAQRCRGSQSAEMTDIAARNVENWRGRSAKMTGAQPRRGSRNTEMTGVTDAG